MKITLLYQVSHYIRVQKQRNIKSWDQQNYLVIRGFCYIRPLYNEVPLHHLNHWCLISYTWRTRLECVIWLKYMYMYVGITTCLDIINGNQVSSGLVHCLYQCRIFQGLWADVVPYSKEEPSVFRIGFNGLHIGNHSIRFESCPPPKKKLNIYFSMLVCIILSIVALLGRHKPDITIWRGWWYST